MEEGAQQGQPLLPLHSSGPTWAALYLGSRVRAEGFPRAGSQATTGPCNAAHGYLSPLSSPPCDTKVSAFAADFKWLPGLRARMGLNCSNRFHPNPCRALLLNTLYAIKPQLITENRLSSVAPITLLFPRQGLPAVSAVSPDCWNHIQVTHHRSPPRACPGQPSPHLHLPQPRRPGQVG